MNNRSSRSLCLPECVSVIPLVASDAALLWIATECIHYQLLKRSSIFSTFQFLHPLFPPSVSCIIVSNVGKIPAFTAFMRLGCSTAPTVSTVCSFEFYLAFLDHSQTCFSSIFIYSLPY